MYQTEDLIRSFNFDLDSIMEKYVSPACKDADLLSRYRTWYDAIIRQMKSQRIEKHGHLHDLKDILVELSYLHNTLLNLSDDNKYKEVYERANPYIEEFRDKSNLKEKNQIEILFHALYMKLLLRLRQADISHETEEAFDSMRMMLAVLAKSYHQMKRGELNFFNN